MIGWIIFACVLAAFLLLRVGAEVSYGEQGLRIRVRVGAIRLTLYPRKKKTPQKKRAAGKKRQPEKKRPERSPDSEKADGAASGGEQPPPSASQSDVPSERKEPGPKAAAAQEKKKGGLPVPLMDLISLVLSAAGNVIARIQIDTLEVGYTIAGKADPAGAAIQYGLICAGEGGLVPVLENSFYGIRNRDIRARVDFEATDSLIWLRLALSIRIGQALSVVCRAGWAFLKSYLRKKQTEFIEKNQEGNQNGTKASDQ